MAPKKAAEPVVEKEEVKYTGGRVFNAEDEPLLNEIMNQYMFIRRYSSRGQSIHR